VIGIKTFQRMWEIMLVVALVRCTPPTTPVNLATPIPLSTSTKVSTVTPTPIPTVVEITSFEECIVSGALIQDTFPRQCISNKGEIFQEGLIFSKTYGTANYDTGRFITSTLDGGYLITGDTNGCWVLKLDALGEKEWESTFSQELNQEFELSNTGFVCWLAKQTPDGGYAIMGVGNDTFSGGMMKQTPFIITLDDAGKRLTGQLIVEKAGKIPYLNQAGKLIWLTSLGLRGKVFETIDGGYIIVGHFKQSSPDSNMHMVKTDQNGSYMWDKNLCLDKNISQTWEEEIVCSYDYVVDVIQLQDGSFVMTGAHKGAWLLKTDSTGNVKWIRSYQGELSGGEALIQMADDGFLIAGHKLIDQKQIDGALVKTDHEGNLQWTRTTGGEKTDWFIALLQAPNDEIIIMGWTESFGQGSSDIWLLAIEGRILE
jgi:hypothetical protein